MLSSSFDDHDIQVDSSISSESSSPIPSDVTTSVIPPIQSLAVVPKKPRRLSPGEIDLWHCCIGHVNFQSLYHMTTQGLVYGVPIIPYVKRIRESCILGKHYREKFPKKRTMETMNILELVHTYICNPLLVTSRNHNRYILTFVDDFSRKCWIYFLSAKSQILDKFKEFRALVETKTHRIKCLRSNQGGEYMSKDFISYCKQQGIQRHLTAGYSPQQNAIAERQNKYLLEGIRATIIVTKVPNFLWEEVVCTINYIQNQSPTRVVKLKTLEEVFTGVKPNLSHLRIFGCVAYCHIPTEKRNKLEPKTIATLFIGYDEQSKAYRC
jgi:IS30 family transposase